MGTTPGDTVHKGDMDLRFLVDETQGSGDLVVFEFTVRSHGRVPAPHVETMNRYGLVPAP